MNPWIIFTVLTALEFTQVQYPTPTKEQAQEILQTINRIEPESPMDWNIRSEFPYPEDWN